MTEPVERILDIYNTHLHLAWDTHAWGKLRRGRTKYLQAIEKQGQGWTESTDLGIKGGTHHIFLAVLAARHQSEPEIANTIAHEAVHAAIAITDTHRIASPMERDAEEPFAYLVGWLTEWMWRSRPTP